MKFFTDMQQLENISVVMMHALIIFRSSPIISFSFPIFGQTFNYHNCFDLFFDTEFRAIVHRRRVLNKKQKQNKYNT